MEWNPCRMEVELANTHFYFPQVTTLQAIRNNKQPTVGKKKKTKENVCYFEWLTRECFHVQGINTATQAEDLHGFQSMPAILN